MNQFFQISRRTCIVVCLVVVTAVLVTASAINWFASASDATSPPLRSTQPNNDPIDLEPITITPEGFEPAEITRPQGLVMLAIYNRSGLEEVNLHFEIESGPRQREIRIPRKKLDSKELIHLQPGRYRLTETNNPEWHCIITVTPR